MNRKALFHIVMALSLITTLALATVVKAQSPNQVTASSRGSSNETPELLCNLSWETALGFILFGPEVSLGLEGWSFIVNPGSQSPQHIGIEFGFNSPWMPGGEAVPMQP